MTNFLFGLEFHLIPWICSPVLTHLRELALPCIKNPVSDLHSWVAHSQSDIQHFPNIWRLVLISPTECYQFVDSSGAQGIDDCCSCYLQSLTEHCLCDRCANLWGCCVSQEKDRTAHAAKSCRNVFYNASTSILDFYKIDLNQLQNVLCREDKTLGWTVEWTNNGSAAARRLFTAGY